jgi:excisionase family DNA binding protein
MDNEFLTGAQVARIMQVSRAHAYRMMKSGEIPTVRFGKAVRVRRADLTVYLRMKAPSQNAEDAL